MSSFIPLSSISSSSSSSSGGSSWTGVTLSEVGNREVVLTGESDPGRNLTMVISTQHQVSRTAEGYDYEFVPPADSRYQCPVCMMVLKKAVQTSCGHRFCKACIERWIGFDQQAAECPNCKEPITKEQLFPDNFANREIMNLTVRCQNASLGCQFDVELQRLQFHLDQQCEFALQPCPNRCTDVLLRKDLERHLSSECRNRSVTCELCTEQFPAQDKQQHLSTCRLYLSECSTCRTTMTREELTLHQLNCPKTQISCLFGPLGCSHVCDSQDLVNHMTASLSSHVELIAHALISLRRHFDVCPLFASSSVFVPRPVADQAWLHDAPFRTPYRFVPPAEIGSYESCDITTSESATEGVCMSGPELRRNIDDPELLALCSVVTNDAGFVSGTTNTVTSSRPLVSERIANNPVWRTVAGHEDFASTSVAHTNRRGRGGQDPQRNATDDKHHTPQGGSDPGLNLITNDDLRRQTAELQRTVATQAERLEKLELLERQLDVGRICNGVYVWRIEGVQAKHSSAMAAGASNAGGGTLHSPGFYTSPFGYRLCIRINLNGIESGFNKFIALFVHFLHGDFDDVVDWPFRGVISLSIIDQSARDGGSEVQRAHIVESLDSKPDLLAFQRPTSTRNHKGFGYKEFAPVSVLSDERYVRNGTMVIRVTARSNSGV